MTNLEMLEQGKRRRENLKEIHRRVDCLYAASIRTGRSDKDGVSEDDPYISPCSWWSDYWFLRAALRDLAMESVSKTVPDEMFSGVHPDHLSIDFKRIANDVSDQMKPFMPPELFTCKVCGSTNQEGLASPEGSCCFSKWVKDRIL